MMAGVSHLNKNGLERWFTIVYYKLAGYRLSNFWKPIKFTINCNIGLNHIQGGKMEIKDAL